MEKHDILKQLEAQQEIQMRNHPNTEAWKAASAKIHALAEQLTGKKPQDARG